MTSIATSAPLHRNRWVHLVIGVTVSTVCLWIATRGLLADPDAASKAWNAFARADYRTLLPIAIATAVFYWFKALRWRLLLTPIGKFDTNRDLFPLVMIGFGFNNLLPIHLGEVIRVVLFTRRHRVKLSAAVSTVALERLFDSVSVLTLLTCGLVLLPGLDPAIRLNTLMLAGLVALLVLIVLLYVFCTRTFINVVGAVMKPLLPTHLREKLTGILDAGATGLAALKHPRLFLGIMALSLGNWFVNAMVIHMALWSFDLPAGPMISCIVLGLTAIGAAVPSAPGYFGVIQLCFMTVLSVFTNDEASVFAASIYYHLIEYVLVTLTGLYYFNTTGLTLAQVEEEAEREVREEAELEAAGVESSNVA